MDSEKTPEGLTESTRSEPVRRQDQSRGKQTAILVTAILIAGTIAAFVPGIVERKAEYDKIYPGCWQLIGRDQDCEMDTNIHAFIRGR